MSEFTKEEISLCKQVREKDLLLKPVKEGDWIRNEYGNPSTDLVTSEYIRNILRFIDIKHWFPLWTISDCLEFLRERRWTNYQFSFDKKGKTEIHIIQTPFEFRSTQEIIEQGTFLEVLLKAILAVLEEEGK